MFLDLDVEANLRGHLDSARKRFLKRAAALDLIIEHVRSGFAPDDGLPRLRQATNEQRIAIAEFEFALRRYVEYVMARRVLD
jgi:hypothetical protein